MQIYKVHYQLYIWMLIIFPVLIDCTPFPHFHGFVDEEFEAANEGLPDIEMNEAKNYVHAYLYRRNDPPIVIQSTKEKSMDMLKFVNHFDPMRKTKIVIHGWVSSVNQSSIHGILMAYLDTTDYNVIGIDWKPISYRMYTSTIKYLPEMGKYVGELINFLIQDLHTSHHRIHIVGHSLGAHVAGIAGNYVINNKVGRITGLDPALPGFKNKKFTECLDKSDAHFVDVIHTAGGVIAIPDSIGHVDFYPNSGKSSQHGCSFVIIRDLICSHRRAVLYFIESIYNPNYTFMAHKCDSWKSFKELMCHNTETIQMGEHTNMSANGKFYLLTRSKSPYSIS